MINDKNAADTIDITENFLKILEGYPRTVGIMSLMSCIGILCLDGKEYAEGSMSLISGMSNDIFSNEGLEKIITFKEVICHRALNSNFNKKQ